MQRPGDTRNVSRTIALCGLLAGGAGGAGGCDAGSNADDFGETSTLFTGHLGELGELKPSVSSFVIENSGEVLVYMSTATLTCPQIQVSRWLGSVEAGAQVVEIVVPTDLATGTSQVEPGGAEVNYTVGGRSSAYEKSAVSGHVTFTRSLPGKTVEGTFIAEYTDAADSVKGRFLAEFCNGGQGY